MSKRSIGVLCVAVLLYGTAATVAAITLPAPGDAHATYLAKGIWTWYGDPKAIYFKGNTEKTYVSFFDINTNPGGILVSSYDHATKKIESSILGTDGYDDHNHPSILVRNSDHRILTFWCGHSGGQMKMRVSTNPEDVKTWDPLKIIISGAAGSNFTYPNPYQLSAENNRIYLFYRGIDWQQTMTWSDDGGNTWIKPFKFFQGANRPYHKYHSNGVDEIHTICEYDNRALPMQYLCIKKGGFYGADGQLIRTIADVQANGPIKSADIPNIFVRGTTTNCAGWDIALDAKGRPVFVMDSIQNGHHYWWTRWTGTKWEKHYLMNSGKEMGGEFGFACGITLDHANPNIVYLSHWVKKAAAADSSVELERWITSDSGTSWQKTVLTANSVGMNTRPCVPRGYKGGDISVIWLYVRSYTNWFGPFDSDVKMYTFTTAAQPQTVGRATTAGKALLTVAKNGISVTVLDPKTTALALYDIAGRLVKDLTPLVRTMDKGDHPINIERGKLPYGTYLAKYTSGNYSRTLPVVIAK
jgi:hypothetical protein